MLRRGLLVLVTLAILVSGVALLLGGGAETAAPAFDGMQLPSGIAADSLRVPGVPEEVGVFLENGQSWRAARVMRAYLRETPEPAPEAYLLAARAEAGWGGWNGVRRYLQGRSWLDEVQSGEGWFWLGRALEEEEEWQDAWEAYDRYLRAAPENPASNRRAVARLRQGLVLLRLERVDEATRLLEALRAEVPAIAARVDLLAAEALAGRGDTAAVRRLAARASGDPALRQRGRRALLRAHEEAEDPAGALVLARTLRQEAGSDADRAWYAHAAGRLAHELGDEAAAREELRAALRLSPTSAPARNAAGLLDELGGLSTADRLAVARAFDAGGLNAKAAAHYRSWLATETGDASDRAAVRQALGQALFDTGDYRDAIAALSPLPTAEALYLTGRAEYRRGNRTRGRQILLRVASEFPGSRVGSEGLFLVADLEHDDQDLAAARPLYRRVADEFPGTDRAGLSLMRLAGSQFEAGDYQAAARTWEEYRSSYPSGQRWLESTYWAGRAREAGGDRPRAEELYRQVRAREPLSYYSLRASDRLGIPFWPPAMGESPARDSAAERRVAEWMRGVDLLRSAGLHREAEAEADRWVDEAGENRALLYPLGEALNERGLTVRGTRIGLRLQRSDPLNPRLLRIVYPFPYRPMVEAEALGRELDPFIVAALIRQESLFKARISSPVGARGLMQVMPETGRALARGVGIDEWDAELLYQPEINTHLGTRYLREQMDRWNGSLPSVFSAYNAGPNRIQVWQRFPEYRDEELFTERIPYRETRDYVKILTRNIAVYRGLYGGEGARDEWPGGPRSR